MDLCEALGGHNHVRFHRRQVHHSAAVAVAEVRGGDLRDDEHALEIDVEDEVPLFVGEVLERTHRDQTGVVDEVVEASPFGDGRFEGGAHCGAVAHIGFEGERRCAVL